MLSKIALLTLVSTVAAEPPKGKPQGGTAIPDPVSEKMPCTCKFGKPAKHAAKGKACPGSYVPMCPLVMRATP